MDDFDNSYSLRILDPEHPPLELIEDFIAAMPYAVQVRREELVVTGADRETLRRRTEAVLAGVDEHGWQSHLSRL